MQLSRDRARRGGRAATLVIIGAAALLTAAWAAPRTSEAVAAWLHTETVKTRTLAVADRLAVAAAASEGGSPGDARSPAETGPADVAPQTDPGKRSAQSAPRAIVTLDAGADFTMVGVMCDVPAAPGAVTVRLRTSLDGRRWGSWYEGPLEVAADGDGAPRAFMDAMWTGAGRYIQVSARADGARAPLALGGVRLMAIDTDGGDSLGDRTLAAVRHVVATIAGVGLTPTASAAVTQPAWVTRAGWGADESLRKAVPVTAPVRMAFVHHTAGGNTYTQAQAPGIVRGIYAYHTEGLGWNDIGYNFLIDRFGTVYVGRYGGPRQGVVGAHTYGFNTGSTGVSIMGTYTSEVPPPAALDALGRLLAWKLELHGLDPLASVKTTCGATEKYAEGQTVTLPVVSGHRDANSTACPGDALYAKLGAVRSAAAAQIKLAAVIPEPYVVTLALSATEVPVDTAVTYKGTVKTQSGAPARGTVTVQKRLAGGGAWANWRTATLSSTGAYSVAVKMTNAPRDWQFRARKVGDGATNLTGTSPLRDLRVAVPAPYTVTLALSAIEVPVDTTVTYKGTVKTQSGAPARGTVTVQKRLAGGGAWANWRTATLSSTGAYSVAVKMTNAPRDWQFRARKVGDGATNLTGYSPVRNLKVTVLERSLVATEATSFTIVGRGYGHGIGMSQWGAYGLATQGSAYRAILRHYYTGIGFSAIDNPTVRVRLRSGLQAARLTCAADYAVQGSAAAVTIAGGTTATTTYVGGNYRVVAGSWSRDFGAPVTFTPTRGQLNLLTETDAKVTGLHRGTIRVVAAGGALMIVNHVRMEGYLRGVVPYEMPASWPAGALKAQACAARAYAERARRSASGQFDLYCDVRSQVYGGRTREDARSDAAVKDTAGVVPTYGGEPIQAFYFSSSGGHTENVELVWQTSTIPYLKGVEDPYDSYAPLHTWGPISRTPAQLASALGTAVQGSLRAVYPVERGASRRIVKAAIIGSGGTTFMHGSTLRVKAGLNSAWATFKSMSVAPSATDQVTIASGDGVTLSGRVYPALAAGATVTLFYDRDGTWRTQQVSTTRQTQSLPDGYRAVCSTYRVTVSPSKTTKYYFLSGRAASPTTTITVR